MADDVRTVQQQLDKILNSLEQQASKVLSTRNLYSELVSEHRELLSQFATHKDFIEDITSNMRKFNEWQEKIGKTQQNMLNKALKSQDDLLARSISKLDKQYQMEEKRSQKRLETIQKEKKLMDPADKILAKGKEKLRLLNEEEKQIRASLEAKKEDIKLQKERHMTAAANKKRDVEEKINDMHERRVKFLKSQVRFGKGIVKDMSRLAGISFKNLLEQTGFIGENFKSVKEFIGARRWHGRQGWPWRSFGCGIACR